MFPSREEAIQKAKENIPAESKIVSITDDWTKLNVYNIRQVVGILFILVMPSIIF